MLQVAFNFYISAKHKANGSAQTLFKWMKMSPFFSSYCICTCSWIQIMYREWFIVCMCNCAPPCLLVCLLWVSLSFFFLCLEDSCPPHQCCPRHWLALLYYKDMMSLLKKRWLKLQWWHIDHMYKVSTSLKVILFSWFVYKWEQLIICYLHFEH